MLNENVIHLHVTFVRLYTRHIPHPTPSYPILQTPRCKHSKQSLGVWIKELDKCKGDEARSEQTIENMRKTNTDKYRTYNNNNKTVEIYINCSSYGSSKFIGNMGGFSKNDSFKIYPNSISNPFS